MKIFVLSMALNFCLISSVGAVDVEDSFNHNSQVIESIAGDKFAGTWFSNDGSQQILALTSKINTNNPLFDNFNIIYVKYSKNALESLQNKITKEIKKDYIYGVALDIQNNRILLRANKINFALINKVLLDNKIDMGMIVFEHQEAPLNLFAPVSKPHI